MKKINFFNRIIKSITNFDFYTTLIKDKTSVCVGYFLKLMILYAVIMTIGIVYNTNQNFNKIENVFKNQINEFEYNSGILNVNNDTEIKLFDNSILVDTSKENNEENEKYYNLVFEKKCVSIKMNNNIYKIRYNEYFSEDINKNDIQNILAKHNTKAYFIIFIIIVGISAYIAVTISTIFDVLIISIMGCMLIKMSNKIDLKYKEVLKIAIHSITLPIILCMFYYIINIVLNFNIKYFSIMYTTIATIYMITAILLISSNNNVTNKIDN